MPSNATEVWLGISLDSKNQYFSFQMPLLFFRLRRIFALNWNDNSCMDFIRLGFRGTNSSLFILWLLFTHNALESSVLSYWGFFISALYNRIVNKVVFMLLFFAFSQEHFLCMQYYNCDVCVV